MQRPGVPQALLQLRHAELRGRHAVRLRQPPDRQEDVVLCEPQYGTNHPPLPFESRLFAVLTPVFSPDDRINVNEEGWLTC